jgi:hypothetical protein
MTPRKRPTATPVGANPVSQSVQRATRLHGEAACTRTIRGKARLSSYYNTSAGVQSGAALSRQRGLRAAPSAPARSSASRALLFTKVCHSRRATHGHRSCIALYCVDMCARQQRRAIRAAGTHTAASTQAGDCRRRIHVSSVRYRITAAAATRATRTVSRQRSCLNTPLCTASGPVTPIASTPASAAGSFTECSAHPDASQPPETSPSSSPQKSPQRARS